MIDPIVYEGDIKLFVDAYDLTSDSIWNETTGYILQVRKAIRKHYLPQQKFQCAYCRIEKKEEHGMTWDVEHILPKSIFPQFLFEPQNLAVACKECNEPKDNYPILEKQLKCKNIYPTNTNIFKIVHPHFDIFSEHFEMLSLNGRLTYRVLNLHKARFTYTVCNFFRFDCNFVEWESFDEMIVTEFSRFLNNCPPDATPMEITRMLNHLNFRKDVDF